jgi:hypothetical protein
MVCLCSQNEKWRMKKYHKILNCKPYNPNYMWNSNFIWKYHFWLSKILFKGPNKATDKFFLTYIVFKKAEHFQLKSQDLNLFELSEDVIQYDTHVWCHKTGLRQLSFLLATFILVEHISQYSLLSFISYSFTNRSSHYLSGFS